MLAHKHVSHRRTKVSVVIAHVCSLSAHKSVPCWRISEPTVARKRVSLFAEAFLHKCVLSWRTMSAHTSVPCWRTSVSTVGHKSVPCWRISGPKVVCKRVSLLAHKRFYPWRTNVSCLGAQAYSLSAQTSVPCWRTSVSTVGQKSVPCWRTSVFTVAAQECLKKKTILGGRLTCVGVLAICLGFTLV